MFRFIQHIPRASAVAVVSTLGLAPFAVAASEEADSPTATLPPVAERSDVTFDADIKPLMERSCTKCHGEEKQKAKLRLDSRDAVLAGARDHPILVAGKSEESKIVLAVAKATEEEDEWMPPPDKAQELSAEEIGLLRAWIDQGAN